jgi:hypothetical protein
MVNVLLFNEVSYTSQVFSSHSRQCMSLNTNERDDEFTKHVTTSSASHSIHIHKQGKGAKLAED